MKRGRRTHTCRIASIKALIFLGIFLAAPSVSQAMDVTLAWDENTEEDLAGYRVYVRTADEDFDYDNPAWEGTKTSCTIRGLANDTTYCFVGRAYDLSGNESEDSYEDCVSAGSGARSSGSNGSGCFIRSIIK